MLFDTNQEHLRRLVASAFCRFVGEFTATIAITVIALTASLFCFCHAANALPLVNANVDIKVDAKAEVSAAQTSARLTRYLAQAPHTMPLSTGQRVNSGGPAKVTTLRSAVKNGQVSFSLKGDGQTTSSVHLQLRNKTAQALSLVIPENEVFRPNSANVQTMMITRDLLVRLAPHAQVEVSAETVCASFKSLKPPPVDGVSFEIGSYPDLEAWQQLSKIMAAACDLDKGGAFADVPISQNKRHTIAQYAIWLFLGRRSDRSEDQLNKNAIEAGWLQEIDKQLNQNPNFRNDLKNQHKLTEAGGYKPNQKEKEAMDQRVALILDATDLTLKRSSEADLKGIASLPEDSSWATLDQVGVRAFEKGDYTEAQELLEAAVTEAEALGAFDARLAISLNNLGRCLTEEGLADEAQPLLTRALAIRQKSADRITGSG